MNARAFEKAFLAKLFEDPTDGEYESRSVKQNLITLFHISLNLAHFAGPLKPKSLFIQSVQLAKKGVARSNVQPCTISLKLSLGVGMSTEQR